MLIPTVPRWKNSGMWGTCSRLLVSSLAALLVALAATVAAQDRSIADGVYSDDQAARGSRVYRESCAACHAPNMRGGEMGPGLVGEAFLEGWDGAPLSELMLFTSETMPQDNPGGLTAEQFTDVLAHILKSNEFPAGDAELADLDQILIQNGR